MSGKKRIHTLPRLERGPDDSGAFGTRAGCPTRGTQPHLPALIFSYTTGMTDGIIGSLSFRLNPNLN